MSDVVAIVIVSHSRHIAIGIREMIHQIAGEVQVELASGTEGEQIGTNINRVHEALDRIDKRKEVLIFYDIGSAKMNAEFAIEMYGRSNAYIMDVPLVEGAYIAAVKASIGKSAKEIHEKLSKTFMKFLKQI